MLEITFRSVWISMLGVLLAVVVALPWVLWVARVDSRSRRAQVAVMHALMALPPVIVGLGLYRLFAPSGVLDMLDWLYTPSIMVVAQFVLVLPIVFSLLYDSFREIYVRFEALIESYPPHPLIVALMVVREARIMLFTAALAGFGRALGEVGAVLIVGGNIRGETEMLATVIAAETGRGNIDYALSLGGILFGLAFGIAMIGGGIRMKIQRKL